MSKKLFFAFLLFSSLSFFTFSEEETEVKNPELQKNFTVIIDNHRFNLDPHTACYNSEAQVLNGLYEGLFSYDPVTLEPLYALCSEYRISRDKKRWTFILRDNILFSNGKAITAEDFRTSWLSMIKNPDAPYSSLCDTIKGAKAYRTGEGTEENVGIYASDEKTLIVHLNTPMGNLPRILCMSSFAVKSSEPDVYSGAFTLETFDAEKIILKRNENYWDKKNTALEQITFKLSDKSEENAWSFNTGDADWISSAVDLSKLLTKNNSLITAEFATEYLFFKLSDKDSVWNKKEFREALLEAVPWDKLRENTFVKAETLVYALNGYPKVQGFQYTDKFQAADLMKAAREKNGIDESQKLSLRIAVNESEYMKKNAELLKSAWEELGVELSVIELPSYEYLNSIGTTDAEIFSYTWIGDYADPLAFLELFRSDSTLNVSGWKNSDFDKLLDESQLYTDENHVKLASQAEQLLLDDAVIMPVQHPVSLNIIDLNATGGWAQNSFDLHPLKYLWRKESKEKVPNLVMAQN